MPPEPSSKPKVKLSKVGKGHSGQAFAANAMDLAKALGVSARTIKLWKTIDGNPGADGSGRYRIKDWQEWAVSHGKTIETSGEPQTKQEWEIQRIKKQVEGLDLDLQLRKGTLMEVSKGTEWALAAGFAINSSLDAIPDKAAPQLAGLPAAEIAIRLRDMINEAKACIHRAPWEIKK